MKSAVSVLLRLTEVLRCPYQQVELAIEELTGVTVEDYILASDRVSAIRHAVDVDESASLIDAVSELVRAHREIHQKK